MIDSADTIDRIVDSRITDTAPSGACGTCGASLGGRRYLQLEAADVVSFCSEDCLRAAQAARRKRRRKARRRGFKVGVIGVAIAGACLAPHQGRYGPPQPPVARAPTAPAARTVPPGWFGPEWPPTDTSLLAALGRDAWIHPLAGPVRRMPRNDTRVFGAARAGNRAVECRNGHCGVDLGGEIWGEHVRAVHDGVVEYVRRGANAQRGGEFVRIAHRNGTVITQYFHLAAIPRRIERGTFVKGGDVIGLVGDTGVKDSPPHLHFSISIKPSPDRPEKYFDPEPLVALWPLRVPLEGTEAGLVTTLSEPGVPLGSAPPMSGRKRKLPKKGKGGAATAETNQADAPAEEDSAPGPAASESSGDE